MARRSRAITPRLFAISAGLSCCLRGNHRQGRPIMFVYRKHKTGFSVGWYKPTVHREWEWVEDSDFLTLAEAERRVNYLNGGTGAPFPRGEAAAEALRRSR